MYASVIDVPCQIPEVIVPSADSPLTAKFVVVALVEVMFVNTPVEGVVAPMVVLSIVPASMVKLFATYASAIAVPCQTPDVIVPTVARFSKVVICGAV